MVLKKQERDVVFLGLDVKYKQNNSKCEIQKEPDLYRILKKIAQISENEALKKDINKSISMAIKDISIDDERNIGTILFIAGDKDINDPTFWNSISGEVRTERAAEHEKICYSCHLVIDFNRLTSGRLCSVKEKIPLISEVKVFKFLNKILKEHCTERHDDGDTEKNIYPYIDYTIMGTKNIKEILQGKTSIEFEAECIKKTDASFDEDAGFKSSKETIKLKPVNFFTTFSNIIGNNRFSRFNEFHVKYKISSDASGSLRFKREEIGNDITGLLFAEKHKISLNNAIEQTCTEIHDELVGKMKELAIRERNIIMKQKSGDGNVDTKTEASETC